MTSVQLNRNFEVYATKDDLVVAEFRSKALLNLKNITIHSFNVNIEDDLPVAVLGHSIFDLAKRSRKIKWEITGISEEVATVS